jgi:ABC-2 type transport system ATP-binding protein
MSQVRPEIEAEGLVRRFGDLVAVNGVDLTVQPGEIFGFLGPNGAGKTTLVRMLVTLLRPSAGRARVAGFDVVKDAQRVRRAIGVALQDHALDPLMTGAELLRLQAVLHGLDRTQAASRTAELLERVGLSAAADRRVGTYSGGMRRRLDLALALIHSPGVLFLDEPTTGLDPSSRVSLWDEIRRLSRDSGTTVFLTTQYMEEADQLCARVAIIDLGRIVQEGTPEALKEKVGLPTLRVTVDRGAKARARGVLAKFGEEVPAEAGAIAIRLPGGAGAVASVVRALDKARVAAESMELTQPSLDDVFAAATGHRLEGAGEIEPETPQEEAGPGGGEAESAAPETRPTRRTKPAGKARATRSKRPSARGSVKAG